MQYLRPLVNAINEAIALRIKETARLNGLVRQVVRQREGQSEITPIDNLNNPVAIDDRWNITLWHRVTGIESEALTGQGRGNKYLYNAKMLLVCSSKREITHDVLVFVLSKLKNVTYQSSDFDASRIIRQETGKSDLNIEQCLFTIEYVLSALSDKCFDECEVVPLASTGTSDCIQVTQGGVIQAG